MKAFGWFLSSQIECWRLGDANKKRKRTEDSKTKKMKGKVAAGAHYQVPGRDAFSTMFILNSMLKQVQEFNGCSWVFYWTSLTNMIKNKAVNVKFEDRCMEKHGLI